MNKYKFKSVCILANTAEYKNNGSEYISLLNPKSPGPRLNIRPSYLRMVISMLKIRRPLGRLIFNMGIVIPGKTVFLIETAPWSMSDILKCSVVWEESDNDNQ